MGIKFTPRYERRIQQVVSQYNKRVRSAYREGKIAKSQLPELASVSLLKKSFKSKKDLDRELANLELFSRKAARLKVTPYVTGYDYGILKQNRTEAIKYWEKQAELLRGKIARGQLNLQTRLTTMERNISILKKPLSEAEEWEISAAARYVEKYRKSFERQATGYRGFLSEVEFVMKNVGVDKSNRELFFEKLSALNPEEFNELYQKNDIISRVYELADSPKYGQEVILNVDEKSARIIIESLLENIDTMVSEVKNY